MWNILMLNLVTYIVDDRFYFPTNTLNCIKLIRLKSACINVLKDN